MPTYTFYNKETETEKDEFFTSYEASEKYLADNPNLERRIKGVALVSGVGGIKVSDGFNDLLGAIKKGSGSGCTIKTR